MLGQIQRHGDTIERQLNIRKFISSVLKTPRGQSSTEQSFCIAYTLTQRQVLETRPHSYLINLRQSYRKDNKVRATKTSGVFKYIQCMSFCLLPFLMGNGSSQSQLGSYLKGQTTFMAGWCQTRGVELLGIFLFSY